MSGKSDSRMKILILYVLKVKQSVDVEIDTLKAMNIGKDYALNSMEDSETSFRFLREKEFLGNSSLLYPLRTVGNHEEVGLESSISKVLHDVANMGIAHALGFVESTNNTSRVGWAKVVSEITKARGPSTDGARMGMPWDFANKEVGLSGWEAGGSFFPEMETIVCSRKPITKKRYGSLLEIQDRVLSTLEKKEEGS
ncbi:hypothetical protein V6N11_059010 [Hibiscus sabdariffa]|uniref:Uncharacterized protein n=1 Tax=Hibiscus sabdariffa TaxID=183260 RepID=A0ABR2U5Z2_9ROSI